MARPVIGTTSRILNPNILATIYSAVVLCEIDPTGTADYCQVFARDDTITVYSKLLLHIRTYVCTWISVIPVSICYYSSSPSSRTITFLITVPVPVLEPKSFQLFQFQF